MIQRLQSIYLLLATIFCSAAVIAPLPFATSGSGESFIRIGYNPYLNFTEIDQYGLLITPIVIAVLAFINIFLYKKRKVQIKLCNFITFLIVALIGASAYFVLSDTLLPDMPSFAAAFPILALLSNWLAKRGIWADEKLVRSMDRLR